MKCGLVLEGGGMRGIFTAGVLDFFMKNNILILLIADTFLLYSKFLAKKWFYDVCRLGMLFIDSYLGKEVWNQ